MRTSNRVVRASDQTLAAWKHSARSIKGLHECYNICHAAKQAQLQRFSSDVSTSTHIAVHQNDGGDIRFASGGTVVSNDQAGLRVAFPIAAFLTEMKAWWSKALVTLNVADPAHEVPTAEQIERHRLNRPIPRGDG